MLQKTTTIAIMVSSNIPAVDNKETKFAVNSTVLATMCHAPIAYIIRYLNSLFLNANIAVASS